MGLMCFRSRLLSHAQRPVEDDDKDEDENDFPRPHADTPTRTYRPGNA